MFAFFEAFDFWSLQEGDMSLSTLSGYLEAGRYDKAAKSLGTALQDVDGTVVKFLIVPLHKNR